MFAVALTPVRPTPIAAVAAVLQRVSVIPPVAPIEHSSRLHARICVFTRPINTAKISTHVALNDQVTIVDSVLISNVLIIKLVTNTVEMYTADVGQRMSEGRTHFDQINRRNVLKITAGIGTVSAVGGATAAAQSTPSNQDDTQWARLSVKGCEMLNTNECGEFVVHKQTERTASFTKQCSKDSGFATHRGYVTGFSDCTGEAFLKTLWIPAGRELTVDQRYSITNVERCAETCRVYYEPVESTS